jgi:hypothetical protein
MSNRLGGKQGTAYLGTNANQPPNTTFNDRPPTQYDTQNVSEGDFWFDRSAVGIAKIWCLVSLAGDAMSKGSLAEWVQLSSGDIETLTGNSGGAVFPDGFGNIDVVGDGTTIDIVGNPGTNTLTVSAVGTGVMSSLTGNSGGPVFPTAGNINVVGAGGISVAGNPGTSTLTITSSSSVTWSIITVDQTAAVGHGYFCNKAGTLALALPASSVVGDVIEVANQNTALGIQFTQAAGQQIQIGSSNTTLGVAGTLTSSAVGDTLKIVCYTANTIWRVTSMVGNWSVV